MGSGECGGWQDASYLVDLCRQSVVFDDIADLASCIERLAADPDVAVVRVKNRLDPCYDPGHSAGYRDVAVLFRLNAWR